MFGIAWIIAAILVGFAGTNRKGGYWRAFFLSLIFSPLLAILFTLGSGKKNPKGCQHCGNVENEAEFCGLCDKNEAGLTREEVNSN